MKKVKLAWVLPVLAILLIAFAEPRYKMEDEIPSHNTAEKQYASQNSIVLAGEITDKEGKPLHGVSVIIENSTTGTISDSEGQFELEVPEKNAVVLSYVGKETIKENFREILSGEKDNEVYHRKYVMKEGVFNIDPEKHFVEKEPPSPPPPPPANENPDEEVFFVVEEMPEYQGGMAGLGAYIKEMEKKYAQEKNLSGRTLVGFTVDENGAVTNIKIIEKDNDNAAGGAREIISGMKDWKPGAQRGKPVPVNFTLPVEF